MYSCPKDSCGFGPEPDRCVHGAWVRDGAAPSSSGPLRLKIPRELAAKLLGLRSQPTPTQSYYERVIAPREVVRQRYRDDAAALALEKKLRAEHAPLCGTSVMRDPETDLLINISEWVARGLNR